MVEPTSDQKNTSDEIAGAPVDEKTALKQLENEELKIRLDYQAKIAISVAAAIAIAAISTFGTIYVAFLKARGTQQLEELKARVEILSSFREEALERDIAKRVRFAHFFSKLAPSASDRDLWANYHSELLLSYQAILQASEKSNGDINAPKDQVESSNSEERAQANKADPNRISPQVSTGSLPIDQRNGIEDLDLSGYPALENSGCKDPKTGGLITACPAQ